MSTFSDKFRETLSASDISIGELSAQSGVSTAMLYKIQSGKRLPDSLETLTMLLDRLHCGLPGKQELVQEYLIEKIGFARYASFQAMKTMLANFAPPIANPLPSLTPDAFVPGPVIHGERNINLFLQQLLLQEFQRPGGTVQMFLALRFYPCFSAVFQLLEGCSNEFGTLTHLFCLEDTASAESILHNMTIFRDVLPMMSRTSHYDPRYCYLPKPNDGTVPYPYYVITSQGVLLIDDVFGSALFFSDANVRDEFYLRFCRLEKNFTPCLHAGEASMETYFHGFHQILGQHCGSLASVTVIGAIPCILPCADMETVLPYAPEGLLQQPELMQIAQEYFDGAAAGGYETFYTLAGLEHVIQTGQIMELQGDFIPRIQQEHILSWLEEFLRRCKTGLIVPRLFKTDLIPVTTHFSMVLRESELMLYCESSHRNTVFSNLAENTLAIVAQHYVACAELLGAVYSPEESIRLTEQIIKKYTH